MPTEIDALKAAADGLDYPSESDAPFEPFVWPLHASAKSARAEVAARSAPGRAIEEVPVERFFAALADSDDADRFRQLRSVLESHLSGLRVFRVGAGEVKVDIYLIGAASGGWAGLHTQSVET